jgi:hypothetical protein
MTCYNAGILWATRQAHAEKQDDPTRKALAQVEQTFRKSPKAQESLPCNCGLKWWDAVTPN